ncbi:glycosyltransferase [Janibacter indicus]|uniref:D-inositol 3-phosphate glycosyltransferase n=1 Tax=Janibacter indicus TaxID=857417 RepID=A0A1W1ZQ74_9MICO|nr:glycosyltransferase [Janibacter indicus]SMC50579.1 Glycosyltransferase involved in cell wall bisynthesis [Janibacter indicus]
MGKPTVSDRARPLEVVILDHTAQLGGAELALLRQMDALAARDDVVARVILFGNGPLVDRLRDHGHEVEVLPLRPGLRRMTRYEAARPATAAKSAAGAIPFVRRLAARLRQLDVDVVHTTSLKADLLGVPAVRLAGRPLVWHVHDRISRDYLPTPVVALVRGLAARAPRAVVANSRATAETLPGARGLVVAHPGLAPDQLAPAPRTRPATPVVGILGRIAPTKGQLEFVRAAAQVVRRHPEATFCIMGSPMFGHEEHEGEIRHEIARLGLDDHVELVGFSDDPAAELDAMTVAVHASPVPEPYGQVVAEAMARGVPVVATDAGGVPEIVTGGPVPVGWLVRPGDVDALAEAITAALDDPDEAERRGAAGWQRARTDLGIGPSTDTIVGLWREVAGRPGPSTHERPRVAIAHDYLTQRGGAERVVLALLRAFPDATVHTTLYDPAGTFPEFRDVDIRVSPLNRVGPLRRHHRAALPFLPLASSLLRIDADLVIASSSGWAHGFPTTGPKLVYCHAPARWLYQSERYLGGDPRRSPTGLALLALRAPLRRWDRRAAARADAYLANSRVVRDRVHEAYGIDAEVLPPPFAVDTTGERAPVDEGVELGPGYHLVVSRLLPYKNVDQVIEAFRGLPERLLVVGAGPLLEQLRAAAPDNVRIATDLTDAQMRWAYSHARALVAASHEDFGLSPLEAGAFGRPTLALRAGGYLDTIAEGVNGAFFDVPTGDAIRAAVVADRSATWDDAAIRAHVEAFSPNRFVERVRAAAARLAS